jgi:hypothetical protein
MSYDKSYFEIEKEADILLLFLMSRMALERTSEQD